MDSAAAHAQTPNYGGFEDGLGKRRLITDPIGTDTLELLCLRDELTAVPAFEFALRERAGRLAGFRHFSFQHVRSVDRLSDPGATLAVVSEHTHGVRLSKIFAAGEQRALDISASLHLIRQLVSAVALLHEHARDAAHGAIGPERLLITPNARLVVVEYVLGSALEQLHYSHERYWSDLRIALPRSAGLPRFDQRADVMQIGVVALSLILGRMLRDDEYPARLADVLASAWAISPRGGFEPLPHGIRGWLGRALQLEPRTAFGNALEARDELDKVLSDDGEYEDEESAPEPQAAPVPRPSSSDAIAAFAPESQGARAVVKPVTTPVPTPAAAPSTASVEPTAPPKPVAEPFTPKPAFEPIAAAKPFEAAAPALPLNPFAAIPAPRPAQEPPDATRSLDPPPAAAKAFDFASVAPAPTSSPLSSPSSPAPSSEPSAPKYVDFQTPWVHDEPADSKEGSEASAEPSMTSSMHSRQKSMRIAAAAVAVLAVVAAGAFGARRYFAPSAMAAMTGTLGVTSNPSGAQVIIDGQVKGVTPLSIALNPGPHMLELHGSGDPRSIPVTITAGAQLSQYIELPKATSATGTLQIRTEPAGAIVTVDDVVKGPSPVTVDSLAAGEHVVHVASDLGSVKQRVTVEAGATSSVVVPLGAAEGAPVSGWISVSAPAEVQVYENKRLLGTSQSDRIMVSAGRHDLDIVNETLGYHSSKTVQVPAGKVAQLKVDWPKGAIALNAIPWADVWIDGEKVGETPIGNLSIPIGAHEVIFRNPDLGEQRHAVSVTANGPARLSVDMRKK